MKSMPVDDDAHAPHAPGLWVDDNNQVAQAAAGNAQPQQKALLTQVMFACNTQDPAAALHQKVTEAGKVCAS